MKRRRLLTVAAAGATLGASARAQGGAARSAGLPSHFSNPPGSPAREGSFSEWSGFFYRGLVAREDVAELPLGHVLGSAETESQLRAANGGDSVTWLGHACFLLRLGGVAILTDPYLSSYASPVAPFGPKRFAPPGLLAKQVPPVDIVLVSHNHYDHLDLVTLEGLAGVSGAQLVAPLRVPAYVRSGNFGTTRELDWHDSVELGGLKVTALPAIHFSARSLFDRNESLWAGYLISAGDRVIYFAGDTGYGPVFRKLAADMPAPDLALLPIGAYEPRKLMRAVHCTPEEAVQIGLDLGARQLCAMHWGTIRLTDEPAFEPPVRFRAAADEAGYGDRAWVMAIGETRQLG